MGRLCLLLPLLHNSGFQMLCKYTALSEGRAARPKLRPQDVGSKGRTAEKWQQVGVVGVMALPLCLSFDAGPA
jgi:hypothetical protein